MSTTLKDPVQRKLAQAYTTLIVHHPFFATLLLRLVKLEDPSAPTMWTDGKHLGYNPDFVAKLTRDELVGVLCHEVLHVANLHPWRRQARKPREWNIACDAVVNHLVKECQLVLPAGGVAPVPDKAAEEVYRELPPQPQCGCGQGQQGGGQGQSCPNCSDPGGAGEVRDARNDDGTQLSEAQRNQGMAEAKVAVQQALNAAKRAGKLPAGLKRFAEELLEPKMPWNEILAQFIDGQAKNDYSWMRPNKRYVNHGLMLPSLHSPGYGEVVFGCDTSGSIDQRQLVEICSEVLGCMDAYTERGNEPEVTVAWFDHAVYPQVVTDASELDPKGGGGTSFRVVMEWLATREPTPKALIMVTDGYCGDFGEQPACPVLWILTHSHPQFTPPFGEVAFTINE